MWARSRPRDGKHQPNLDTVPPTLFSPAVPEGTAGLVFATTGSFFEPIQNREPTLSRKASNSCQLVEPTFSECYKRSL